MIKQEKLGFQGISQDIAKDKNVNKYFSARNIRVLATNQQSTFSMTNEHGNELIFQIPIPSVNIDDTRIEYVVNGVTKFLPYVRNQAIIPGCEIEENYTTVQGGFQILTSEIQRIIGVEETRNSAVIITTDNKGFDCVWELTGINNQSFDLELKYMNNLSLSTDNLVQIVYNYENSIIEKIYFADGKNQLRYMNLRQSMTNGDLMNLADVESTSVDVVSTFDISQPTINNIIPGGSHTSGMIQYAYGLYVLNGAQTTISPASELAPLGKGEGLGGGAINEVVGRTVIVNIPTVDNNFTHIKLYAIKYTSYNQIPEISVIADREIDSFTNFTYYDDGSVISSVSLAEFTFLGSDPIIPQHIATKDSRLFPINVKEIDFDVDLDTRVYAYDNNGAAKIWEEIALDANGNLVGVELTVPNTYSVPERHDAVNRDYDVYRYQADGTTLGAEGLHIKVEIDQSTLPDNEADDLQFFKDREIYRLGIEFFNRRGQRTTPKWMMDLRAPEGNLEGNYNKLKVELKPEFYTWLNTTSNFETEDDKPVGYRILRAHRTLADQTILTQGMINPTVANYRWTGKHVALADRMNVVNGNDSSKMPSMLRMFEDKPPFIQNKDYHELSWYKHDNNSFSQLGRGQVTETLKSPSSDDWRAQTFQCNRLMQMYSPEILFNNPQIDSSYKLNVVGLVINNFNALWAAEVNTSSQLSTSEAKFTGDLASPTIHLPSLNPNIQTILGTPGFLNDNGLFGPTNGENNYGSNHLYRRFTGGFIKNDGTREYEVYGSPELTEKGADFRAYNGDFAFRYSNHLLTLLQDDWRASDAVNNDSEIQVLGSNSHGARCITFAEGSDDPTFDIAQRRSIEEIYQNTNIAQTNGILICEFIKDNNTYYLGNIYGGNTFESKSVSTYLGIGTYTDIDTNNVTINSPGDTFVQNFTFARISKTDNQVVSRVLSQTTELVSYRCETTVDLKNRNDISHDEWDNRFHPKSTEFHQYNDVYSQQPTLVQTTDPGFKFKKVKEFDTRIMASKLKIPGENIDNWTDFLLNENMNLDGKYGPINGVVNFRDEIFTFQDNGVARISINPRVQTTGSDGVVVQLGVGGVLHDYQYLTTESGCLNKWAIVASNSGFYYYDLLNNALVGYQGGIKGLSDQKGLHHFFINNSPFTELSMDNPVNGNGISCGYDSVNNDIYFSFHKSTDPFTLSYNEAMGEFTSFYDYVPAWYINKGKTMVTTNPNDTQLWNHFTENRNSFYGNSYPSSITYNISPNGDRDHVFNNASYKMEMTDQNNNDLPLNTLTNIRLWNDYQDSGTVPIILRQNVNRRFRHWKLNFPRNANSRDRIRNPWTFATFTLNNPDSNKMVLHDITVHYTEY